MSETNIYLPTGAAESRSFITKVFGWMGAGLALTGWISWMVGSNPALIGFLLENRVLFYGLIIGEFALVVALSGWARSMTPAAATLAFLFYAAFNGVTLSMLFMVYTSASIASTFFLTAGTFAIMSFYGAVTKKDLSSIGNLCFMALVGVILATVVNIFLRSEALVWVTTYVGLFVFVGLTAYDTQRLKNMNLSADPDGHNLAILGALTLYLDFVNMFIYLLRLTGKRR